MSPGRILKATRAQDTIKEFQDHLSRIKEEFNQALTATVYMSVMTAAEEAECVKISNWLTPLDFVGRLQDIISRHTPGTGSWFLERNDIQDWMNDRSDIRRLWFTAPRKFFRSIIKLIIVEEIESGMWEDNDGVSTSLVV